MGVHKPKKSWIGRVLDETRQVNRNEPPRKLEIWLNRERQLNVAHDRTILGIWEKLKSNSDPMAKV